MSFLLIAIALFLLILTMNRLRREKEPAPAPATPEDVVLLREIRDALTMRPSLNWGEAEDESPPEKGLSSSETFKGGTRR